MWALIILIVMLHIGKLKIVTVDTIQPREFLSWTSINSYIIHKYIHKTPTLPVKVFVSIPPLLPPWLRLPDFHHHTVMVLSECSQQLLRIPDTTHMFWRKNVNTLRFCHEELPKKAQNNILGTPLVFFINRVYN